jgi:hypothetical protein
MTETRRRIAGTSPVHVDELCRVEIDGQRFVFISDGVRRFFAPARQGRG